MGNLVAWRGGSRPTVNHMLWNLGPPHGSPSSLSHASAGKKLDLRISRPILYRLLDLLISQMPKQPFQLDLIDHSQQHTNLDFGPFSSIPTPTSHAGLRLRVSVDRQPDSIIRSLSYKACMTTEPQTLILKRANCLQQIPADPGEAAGAFRVAVLLCLLVSLCLCSKPQFSVHQTARERAD
jgi:hypothetical protein